MNPTLFDELQATLTTNGAPAAIDRLCAQLRDDKDYGNLFYALLLKQRHELGVSPIPTGSAQALPAAVHAPYEDAIRDAARTVGQLYLDAADIPHAWMYYRMLGEPGPVVAALENYQPGDDEESGTVIEIAFHQGAHPRKGFEWVVQRYGICSAITTLTGQDMSSQPDVREHCIQVLTRALYRELTERLRADITEREGKEPAETTVRGLIANRVWLFGEDFYHIDVSHLSAVVQMGMNLPPGDELQMARELCEYGQHLAEHFRYPADPPFEDQYRDYGIYFATIAGDGVEEGIAHFRAKAEQADPYTVGTYPAQVLVNLLLRLNRPAEALAAARKYLASADPQQLSCPGIPELCQRAGDFRALADVAREQGDAVHFLAGLLADRQQR